MRLIINPKIFVNFPKLVIGVAVVKGADNTKQFPEIDKLFLEQQAKVRSAFTSENLKENPCIKVWQEAYRSFKSKPSEYRSSIENLYRMITRGKELRKNSSLVDIYNYISIKYCVPAGGQDIDQVKGDILLTYAGTHEAPIAVLGDEKKESPYLGEIIYKDENGAVCRRWNWREADRTKLTQETRNAVLVFEALPPLGHKEINEALAELKDLIERFCGGAVTTTILTKDVGSVKITDSQEPEIEYFNNQEKQAEDLIDLAADEQHSQEHTIRVEKVLKLRDHGIEPWPSSKSVDGTCVEVVKEFEKQAGKEYKLAGRLMSMRMHGKTIFADLQDASGRLQIYIRKDDTSSETFELLLHSIDIGDIVWVKGFSFVTKMGEITLHVQELALLSKCLYPLPEKFHGLTDIETKYRQRYLDLITNKDSRLKFIKRSTIVRLLRSYLDGHGFMEVETPMLHPIAGGAAARPFITHYNALNSDFYLRIAPELYLKRLVIGGFERVYEINRNFRNEGVSTRHNPEFTMVEMYMAYHDYLYIMDFVEALLKKIMQATDETLKISFGDRCIDFSVPFKRMSIKQSVMHYGNYTEKDLSKENIDTVLREHSLVLENKEASLGQKIFALFEKIVEHQLIQPTFITEFPVEISPLAKRDDKNPEFAARFELFIGGMEIANGFNELNDPFDQAERFKQQLKAYAAGDTEAHQYDADYVLALEYGLPPTVGVGIGIDRLVMLATNTTSIKDVILFPTLRKK